MKPLALLPLLLLLLLPALAPAQCYTGHLNAGKKYLSEKKYDEAIVRFEAAKKCRLDKPADGDKQMDALIDQAKKAKTPPPPNPATKTTPTKTKPQPGPTEAEKQAEATRRREAEAAARADSLAWKYAQVTLAGCKGYLSDFPNGRYTAAARQCVRDHSDDDSDGILNKDDRCPTEKGTAAYDGCPPPPKPTTVTTPLPVGGGDGGGVATCDGCPEMVPVAGGRYTMGCKDSNRDGECYDWEKPPHEVTVRDFYIGKYEVTQAEWRRVMGSNPPELHNTGCDQCPVERVSWNDVQEFIRKLNSQTGKTYRLPTEAEWEYAARGGNKSRGYLYSGSNSIVEVAWYDGNAKSGNTNGSQKTTRPVGTRTANELGIHDMSGNVWEWVEDDWHDNFSGVPTDGRAWVDGDGRASGRVYRGGGWSGSARVCRTAYRDGNAPAGRDGNLGFRLALQL